jgi:hypothetical protein
LSSFGDATAWPWLVAAAWHAWFALRDENSVRGLIAAGFATAAVDRLVTAGPTEWRIAIAYHLMLGAVLFLSYWGRDELTRQLRQRVAPLGLLGSLAMLWNAEAFFPGHTAAFQIVYGGGISIVALAFAVLVRLRVYTLVSACIACGTIVAGTWPWYAKSRVGAPGLDYLILGVCCLLIGLYVSFTKAGFVATGLRWARPSKWTEATEP